ncbi:hypothetical protein HQ531_04930, partial [bacterium]|nr:hypothetical protein [bacterium]
ISFKVFRNDPLDSNSLSDDYITQIIKPENGEDQVLWIGTRLGLNKLNLRTEQFISYIDESSGSDTSSENMIDGNIIFDLAEDSSGNIWLGTNDGLKMLDPETGQITQLLAGETVEQVCIDRRGNIWIGSNSRKTDEGKATNFIKYNPIKDSFELVQYPHGWQTNDNSFNLIYCSPNETEEMLWFDAAGQWLAHYNIVEKTHVFYEYVEEDEESISFGIINSMVEDRRGYLWIGTSWGLSRFDRETGIFKRYYMNSGDESIWDSNLATGLLLDGSDMLWICTYDGIYRLDLRNKPFTNYQRQVGEINSLNSNVVTAIYADSSRILLVGTTQGLAVIDRENNSFGLYADRKKEVPAVIYDIYNGADGFMYFGMSFGLTKHDSTKTGESPLKQFVSNINSYVDYPEVSGVPIGKPVYDIEVDLDWQIWFGTQGGLDHFDRKTELFTHYFPGDVINKLLNPNLHFSNELLLGTDLDGIIRFDRIQRQVISIHSNNPNDSASLSNNQVNDMYEDSKGDIWIATQFGLNLMQRHLNPDSTSFVTYTQEDGLPSNIIKSIQEDTRGNLWLGTGFGLSRFDTENKRFKNYTSRDGLPGNNFVGNTSFRGPDGELLFGTTEGLTTFYPDSIPKTITGNPHIPPVVLTDFLIFNKSVPINPLPGDNASKRFSLSRTISQLEAIELSYRENVFSFKFVALDYQNPMSNQYAYRMEGFSEDWTYTDASNRTATYTNLDPGDYVFHVKGSNNDGLWNDAGTSIRIIITPPWWKTIT